MRISPVLALAALVFTAACGSRTAASGDDTGSGGEGESGAESTGASTTSGSMSTTDDVRFDMPPGDTGDPPGDCRSPAAGTSITGETVLGPVTIRRAFLGTAYCGWPSFRLVLLDDSADLEAELQFAQANGGSLGAGPGISIDSPEPADDFPSSAPVDAMIHFGDMVVPSPAELRLTKLVGTPWDPDFEMHGQIESQPPGQAPSFSGDFVVTYCELFSQVAICE